MTLNTVLSFNGNCQAAFRFYEEHLGGKITFMMTHADAPGATAVPKNRQSAILHASIAIGGTELAGSDAPPDRFERIEGSYLSLNVSSAEEAERVFAVLTQDGQIILPLRETFWAVSFGMLRDRFGVLWMVNAAR
jgi:PhnB protein